MPNIGTVKPLRDSFTFGYFALISATVDPAPPAEVLARLGSVIRTMPALGRITVAPTMSG